MFTQRAFLPLLVVCFAALPTAMAAQNRSGRVLEAGLAAASIHDSPHENYGLHGRVLRSLDERGYLSLESTLLAVVGGETGFLSLDAGLRLRAIPEALVSPLLGAAAGLGSCGEWGGMVARAYGGIEASLNTRLGLTAAYQVSSHGGDQGPNAFTVGLSYHPGSG